MAIQKQSKSFQELAKRDASCGYRKILKKFIWLDTNNSLMVRYKLSNKIKYLPLDKIEIKNDVEVVTLGITKWIPQNVTIGS